MRRAARRSAGQTALRRRAGARIAAWRLEILGPAPAPVVKVNNRYRYRVTVIGRNDRHPAAAC